jgi:hypothetical protein
MPVSYVVDIFNGKCVDVKMIVHFVDTGGIIEDHLKVPFHN